ncbi:MAG TPA: 3-oxoacyl-[acyl-carrier-protein] synthase III C-terminal domain-containing protein [Selenomonadales bacterium]|nr:3-oxoacyl-[acyl-carrier-protein] synthase III C-terminal domain-containing protein [Selenomonadales bacterium]
MKKPRICSVGLAVPPHAIRQEDLKVFAATLFRDKMENLDRLLPVFDNACIAVRHLAQPLEWYAVPHTFSETNRRYEEAGLELAENASRQAMAEAGLSARDIDLVVLVSSTGIATPTLDAKLIQRLGLSPHTARLPIWGLGCAGGVAGLARSAELAGALAGRVVLLVTVELCSLTFQQNDFSKANLVGAGIFADGAAAAILSDNGAAGPELCASHSTLFAATEDIMGWDVVETGLKVRFSRDIPSIVRQHLPALIKQACGEWNISADSLKHYVVHPGGVKVLDAYSESLNLPPETLAEALAILTGYGNMSSASVLFVLKQYLKAHAPSGEYGVMLALGPGFSAEQVLFRW